MVLLDFYCAPATVSAADEPATEWRFEGLLNHELLEQQAPHFYQLASKLSAEARAMTAQQQQAAAKRKAEAAAAALAAKRAKAGDEAGPSGQQQQQPEPQPTVRMTRAAAKAAAAAVAAEMEAEAAAEREEDLLSDDEDTAPTMAADEGCTSRFWRQLTASPASRLSISEFERLANALLVMVPGSVEEERSFSALAYLKNKQRNRLNEPHLNVVLRMFQQRSFTLQGFPYGSAIELWEAGAPKRGRYGD